MKKKYYFYAVAAMALSSCSENDSLVDSLQSGGHGEISFSVGMQNTTRADFTGSDAADKLNQQFVTFGWKTSGTELNNVFPFITLHYEGKDGSTESNSKGWEYVGYESETGTAQKSATDGDIENYTPFTQSIRYWDYDASQYDFLAYSLAKGNAVLEKVGWQTADAYNTHSLIFQVPSADDAAGIYVANQVSAKQTAGGGFQKYQDDVKFNFRNLASKVRIGIYETVPGYSVSEVKFYYDNTNKDAAATLFTTPATEGGTRAQMPTAGTETVVFVKTGETNSNTAVVTTTASETSDYLSFGNLIGDKAGEYNLSNSSIYLGKTSNTATMSAGTEDGWTYVFPNPATELNLKVDYTLTSIDGANDVIHVKGATAKVPANFGEWKMNYAYTYLFKISDKTNGHTGSTDTPAGLYPITFDAVVVNVADGNTQETITQVADNPITTYQNGSAITKDDEYKVIDGKDIWAAIPNIDLTKDNVKLYTAYDLQQDAEGITEATVANYLKNDIVLTDVSALINQTATNKIPAEQTIDNIEKTFDKNIVHFTPEANTIYVLEATVGTVKYYKVIKVGTSGASPVIACPTYTLAITSTDNGTIAATESSTFTAKNDGKVVTGAQTYFTITAPTGKSASDLTIAESTETAGTYTVTASEKAAGVYKVKLGTATDATELTITVKAYSFTTVAAINEGGSTTTTLNLDTQAQTVAVAASATADGIWVSGTGLSATVSGSTITIAAANNASNGKITYTKNGKVVAEAAITVKLYTLKAVGGRTIINTTGENKTCQVELYLDGVLQTTGTLISSDATKATVSVISESKFTVTAVAAGTTNIQMKNGETVVAELPIEVKAFAFTLYTDAGLTTPVSESTGLVPGGTYYGKYTDDSTQKWATLTGTGCTIVKTGNEGVYKTTITAGGGTATISQTVNGQKLVLLSKDVTNTGANPNTARAPRR